MLSFLNTKELILSWFIAVLLGIVQGLTEFLPVSSSGHLVVLQHFLEVHQDQLAFDIAVHFGTLFSIITIYRLELWDLLNGIFQGLFKKAPTQGLKIFLYVFIASIPTGLMGVFLRDYWASLFSQMHFVGFFLITTGLLLFYTRKSGSSPVNFQSKEFQVDTMNWKKALFIGTAQGFAILPGVSRSGSTIAVATFLGVDRALAAFFSFLLLFPAIFGASLLEFSHISWEQADFTAMGIGFLAAYLSGLLGLIMVLKFVKKGRLEVFSPYLWALGSGLIIYSLI